MVSVYVMRRFSSFQAGVPPVSASPYSVRSLGGTLSLSVVDNRSYDYKGWRTISTNQPLPIYRRLAVFWGVLVPWVRDVSLYFVLVL